MNDKPDYIRVTAGPPPEPPAQNRVISASLSHTFESPKIFEALQAGVFFNKIERTFNVTLTHS
jgi:hypothetical protein